MGEFEPPTYEAYQKASEFARFRYKYGLILTALCWIGLIFLIYYMVANIEEFKAMNDPLEYGILKSNLECHCTGRGAIDFFSNGTSKWIPEFEGEISMSETKETLNRFEEITFKER